MKCLSQVSSYTAAILRTTRRSVGTMSYLCGGPSPPPWNKRLDLYNFRSLLTTLHIQLYSSRTKATAKTTSPKKKKKSEPDPVIMEPESKDPFFVVRKGDVVGVYKNFSDCQSQLGSSICDPPVSAYKGESMPKKTEEYLVSRGLTNAIYTIRAADLKDDFFGKLVPCPIEEPTFLKGDDASKKRSRKDDASESKEELGSTSIADNLSKKHAKIDCSAVGESSNLNRGSCVLQFDGASKGNPGQAGAGAVLRADDGSLICKIREGLGIATNNVAEYRAVILGLKSALQKGFTKIVVQGDSKLVCMQIQGLWKVKNENMSDLYEEVKKLKKKFLSFKISHVLREQNSEADAQANLAVALADGQVQECGK